VQGGDEKQSKTQSFDFGGTTVAADLGTRSSWGGFQMGGDNRTSDDTHWGFTGGFLKQNTRFGTSQDSFDLTGWNVGVYAGYNRGPFFLDGIAKGDVYDLKANLNSAGAEQTFSGRTAGLRTEAGFHLGGAGLFVEPMADLTWTTTHLDDANFAPLDTSFHFSTATSLRGSVGARVGGLWGQVRPYLGIYAVQEFDGKNRVTMLTGAGCPSCDDLTDTRPGTYEKATLGFTTTSWNGLEGFAQGDAAFGGHTTGFTGHLGVRWRW
jgi:outer membrane autotransporter protein